MNQIIITGIFHVPGQDFSGFHSDIIGDLVQVFSIVVSCATTILQFCGGYKPQGGQQAIKGFVIYTFLHTQGMALMRITFSALWLLPFPINKSHQL